MKSFLLQETPDFDENYRSVVQSIFSLLIGYSISCICVHSSKKKSFSFSEIELTLRKRKTSPMDSISRVIFTPIKGETLHILKEKPPFSIYVGVLEIFSSTKGEKYFVSKNEGEYVIWI